MASSAKAVVIIRGPGQRFVNLSHLAAVPGGDTIKETDAPFVCAVIQPLGVILDLVSFARKMSQSFFNFHAPASQPGCVGWLHIVLHRSKLLQLTQIPVKNSKIISLVGIVDGPYKSVFDVRMVHNCDGDTTNRKRNAMNGRFIFSMQGAGMEGDGGSLGVPLLRFDRGGVASLIQKSPLPRKDSDSAIS